MRLGWFDDYDKLSYLLSNSKQNRLFRRLIIRCWDLGFNCCLELYRARCICFCRWCWLLLVQRKCSHMETLCLRRCWCSESLLFQPQYKAQVIDVLWWSMRPILSTDLFLFRCYSRPFPAIGQSVDVASHTRHNLFDCHSHHNVRAKCYTSSVSLDNYHCSY